MQTQTVINMRNFIVLFFLLALNLGFSQKTNDLYLIYEDVENIFEKPTSIDNKNLKYIVYSLCIPNQSNPRVLFDFKDKDSTEIDFTYKGGNGHEYYFNFFYDSRKHEKFYIKKNKYIKNIISLGGILSSNVETFHEVLKRANKIFILEETDKEGNNYIAREVSFSMPARL